MDLIALELNRTVQSGGNAAAAISFTDQLATLIRGIGLHSIESNPDELIELQRQLGEVAAKLNAESSPDDMMAAISGALKVLEDYNGKASIVFKSQVDELRSMVAAMTDTLQFIASSSETSVKQLSFVESQLVHANGLDDLRQLKTYTAACLNLVKRESTRLQVETREKISALQNDVERLSERLKTAAVEQSEDPVTGLPARVAAEQAMETRISSGKSSVAALFLMDRLITINARFGHDVGDDVVRSCAQMVAKKLSGATLYRWSGPGFLALFDPLVSETEAQSRARQAAAQQLEKNIEAGGRMLLVVVGVSCQIHQINAQTSADDVFRRLDTFMVAGQGQS